MRKVILMVGTLLALTATLAMASGTELSWNACYGQAGTVSLRTSACSSTLGSQSMFASFRPPAGVNALEGIEVFIDYQIAGGSLGCWWDFSLGATRNSALTALFPTPTDLDGLPLVACDAHYFLENGGVGGGGMVVTGADRGQMRGIGAIAAGSGQPVAADVQQYGIGFRISNSGTGAGCLGCASPGCFVLNTINLTSLGLPNVVLNSPHPGSQNWVAWQDAAGTNCPGATPTRSSTWGQVKSLYR